MKDASGVKGDVTEVFSIVQRLLSVTYKSVGIYLLHSVTSTYSVNSVTESDAVIEGHDGSDDKLNTDTLQYIELVVMTARCYQFRPCLHCPPPQQLPYTLHRS